MTALWIITAIMLLIGLLLARHLCVRMLRRWQLGRELRRYGLGRAEARSRRRRLERMPW